MKTKQRECTHCDSAGHTELVYQFKTCKWETWFCSCCGKNFDVRTEEGEP